MQVKKNFNFSKILLSNHKNLLNVTKYLQEKLKHKSDKSHPTLRNKHCPQCLNKLKIRDRRNFSNYVEKEESYKS